MISMKFKVLEWMRKVRDEDYGKTKEMSLKGKIEYTRKTAKKNLQSLRARDIL